MYICIDTNNNAMTGKTLKEAWDKYEKEYADDPISYLKFFKAEAISVELIEKPTVVKVPVEKPAAKKPTTKK